MSSVKVPRKDFETCRGDSASEASFQACPVFGEGAVALSILRDASRLLDACVACVRFVLLLEGRVVFFCSDGLGRGEGVFEVQILDHN